MYQLFIYTYISNVQFYYRMMISNLFLDVLVKYKKYIKKNVTIQWIALYCTVYCTYRLLFPSSLVSLDFSSVSRCQHVMVLRMQR